MIDEVSDEDNILVICEDPFFSLSYTLHYDGTYQTSLSHRCNTKDEYNWNWEWSIFPECNKCGIDITPDIMDKWRLLLMTDEIRVDMDFAVMVLSKPTWYEKDVYYWFNLGEFGAHVP